MILTPGTKLKNSLIYVGVMLDEKDKPYHLVAKNKDEKGLFTWSAAVKPRRKFVCPTSKELNLMRTISKELRMTEFYWSSTEYKASAWVQRFSDGYQYGLNKNYKYRLRCVRRVDDSTLQTLRLEFSEGTSEVTHTKSTKKLQDYDLKNKPGNRAKNGNVSPTENIIDRLKQIESEFIREQQKAKDQIANLESVNEDLMRAIDQILAICRKENAKAYGEPCRVKEKRKKQKREAK